MEVIVESFQHLLDPDWIMNNGGLYLVLIILFIESGIFFGFFLPGDPLLFVSGMVIATASETPYPFGGGALNLWFWISLFILATVLGYYVGYWFGHKFGYVLHRKQDSWIFKKKYIDSAHEFYERKGGFAIGIARYLPVVRTFAPIIAGMVEMDFKKFSFYNIVGAIIWVVSITSLGYILGENAWVKNNLEFIIIGLVLLVTAPVIFQMVFKKRKTSTTRV
ncbi:MAG TPA: VTT domain-containing protein [Arenibacter sp.]|nr:VTT domain-containing protein [Arenibacter sp.]